MHGCFWHQHEECVASRRPKSNQGFWNQKLDRNFERDMANQQRLLDDGWGLLVLWECELGDAASLQSRIKDFLG